MAKQVKIQETPNLAGRPSAVFVKEDFHALVHNKGYNVIIESAIKCPCKTKNNDHLSTCANCLGTGWAFINPIQDRAVISSINASTEFKDWSEMKLGTVSISLQSRSFLSFMDKIIVKDSQAVQSQVLYPVTFNGHYFAYTIYDIDSVLEVFRFDGASNPYQRLIEGTDFTFERNKLIFTTIPDNDFVVSIRYQHKLMYYTIDIPHVIRNSYRKNTPTGREELQVLPINAMARLAHYVIEGFNYTGDNIIDNSYQII